MHRLLVLHAPALFHVFYRAIYPFIDTNTREEIVRSGAKPNYYTTAPLHH